MIDTGRESGVLDFTEMAAGNVVDKAADGEGLGNPGMGAELLQLVADIFFDVLERVEEGGGDSLGSGAVLDSGAQVVFGGMHQAAIGMVNDHEFLGAQQVMRHHQGTESVIRDDATGVADDVGIALFQSQSANRKTGVHTSEDSELAFRARSQSAEFMGARVDFVGGKNFVNDAHGEKSLAKRKRVDSG